MHLVVSSLTNATIADRLLSFAALLELGEASPFAARAYRRAADLIRSTPAPVADLIRAGRVRELRGIGPGIESRLRELVETGEIAELRDLESRLTPELIGLGRLLGLTSRRVLDIAAALEITTAEELRAAAAAGELRSVPGIGAKTEAQIRASLAEPLRARRGLTLNRSRQLLDSIAVALDGVVAGDARRGCELSFELAVVCRSDRPAQVLDAFQQLPQIVAVLEREPQRVVGVTVEGVPVTAVVAEPASFGTKLLRATGSQAYVAALGSIPDGTREEDVFSALGLPWCPPELREAPAPAAPSALIDVDDLRGDLHCHTVWSDGKASVEEMALAARDRGYEYLAICDHTRSVRVVPGLDDDDVRRQGDEIAEVNERLGPFVVLRGIECDILPDGALDLSDVALSELDWVQISLHAGQRRSRSELTKIVTEAMRSPYARALSHPKGRILNHRPENALDLDTVFEVALETGVALEVNGLPDRLDLSGAHAAEALAAGVDLVLASDGHSARGLASIEYAVTTARRAGAPKGRIVNARELAVLRERHL
jgi:DNA polymerase (family 10)